MVTGEYPYSECLNAAQIYRKVTQRSKPASLERILDEQTRDFISLCLEHEISDRPHAAELLEHAYLRPPFGGQGTIDDKPVEMLPPKETAQFSNGAPHKGGGELMGAAPPVVAAAAATEAPAPSPSSLVVKAGAGAGGAAAGGAPTHDAAASSGVPSEREGGADETQVTPSEIAREMIEELGMKNNHETLNHIVAQIKEVIQKTNAAGTADSSGAEPEGTFAAGSGGGRSNSPKSKSTSPPAGEKRGGGDKKCGAADLAAAEPPMLPKASDDVVLTCDVPVGPNGEEQPVTFTMNMSKDSAELVATEMMEHFALSRLDG